MRNRGCVAIYRRLRNRYFVLEARRVHLPTGAWTSVRDRVQVEHDEMALHGFSLLSKLLKKSQREPAVDGTKVDAGELKFLRDHELVSAGFEEPGVIMLSPMLRLRGGRFVGADRTFKTSKTMTPGRFYATLQRAFEEAT